jgi:hypothetical protein
MKSWQEWAAVLVVWTSFLAGCSDGGLGQSHSALRIDPQKIDFGQVALGGEMSVDMTLTNTSRIPYNVAQVLPTIPNVRLKSFSAFKLEAGESRKFTAIFAPTVEGKVSGAFTITTDDTPDPVQLPLSGTGVKAYVDVLAQALDFGRVELETTVVKTVTVKNPTAVNAPLRFTVEGTDIDEFSSSLANQDLQIAPGQQQDIPIAFQPIRLGLASATLRFEVCPSCEAKMVDLAGEGSHGDLDIFPTRVDFGRVSLGSTSQVTVTIVNSGTDDANWNGASLKNAPAGTMQLDSPLATVLKPNDQVVVNVRFTPNAMGPLSGVALVLDVTSPKAPKGVTLPVLGEGAASCVAVLPNQLNFGTVPVGMSSTRGVDVFNHCEGDVTLLDAQVASTQGGFFSLAQQPASQVIPAGAIQKVDMTYAPKPGSDLSEGTLTLKFQEGNAVSTQVVPLAGNTKDFAPCTATFLPSQLDFGAVPVGAEVNLGIALRNDGTEQCFVGAMQLASGSDPAFTADPVPSTLLDPGKKAVIHVVFKPMALGSFSALAEAWINNPTQNHPTAPIIGEAVQGCFSLQPTEVDWGTRKLTCAPLTRTIVGSNTCTGPVTLTAVTLDAPATNEFTLITQPATPTVLNPGQSTSFVARYVPVDEGDDTAALRVTADGVSYTASLGGGGLNQPARTDFFVQNQLQKVDILFVMDNSGSMMEEQVGLGQNLAAFLQGMQSQTVDYHIAVTTTGIEPSPGGWSVCPGGVEGGEAGRFFPVDGSAPRIITPTTPNAAAVFQHNVNVGVCHWDEQGILAAMLALSPPLVNNTDDPATPEPNDGNAGFLRTDAKLAIILLSDENDHSPNCPNDNVSYYETFFKALKNNDPAMLSISAIVGPMNLSTCPTASESGVRQIRLAQDTGGQIESICTQNWAQSLLNIGNNVFGAQRIFKLTNTPSDPTQIVVQVNGSPVTGWTYDQATNSVEFSTSTAPSAGSVVQITYPLGC